MANKTSTSKVRSPIVSVMGHVDHGKSSVLDSIRGSNILGTEAGGITQAIGASIIPLEVIKKKCGSLLSSINLKFSIPGLLFIDTPGHAAFTTLRKRGGNLADIAILVVDINDGFKPQTIESIEILKSYKTPFLIAANKIDLIQGYRKKSDSLLEDIGLQDPKVQTIIDTKMYELVGELYEKFQLEADRYDRVGDFTKQIGIIPCSALIGQGISELLVMLTGLAQRFLEEKLNITVSGVAKGTILEVKESQGLGITIDVIIYDGTLKRNDTIVIANTGEPIVAKVRALLEPDPLAEMRDKKAKFKTVNEVVAATGVKIAAHGIESVVPGMPLISVNNPSDKEELEAAKKAIQAELEEVMVETSDEGIIIKADTLGSLEALGKLLGEANIPFRKTGIGPISKKDIADAESNLEKSPLDAVILGFNIGFEKGLLIPSSVKVLTNNVIYKLIEDYEEWKKLKLEEDRKKALGELIPVCKLQILEGCLFRQNNPAIVGVEVIRGTLKADAGLMKKDGSKIARVKHIELNKSAVGQANKGLDVAISLPGVTCGRQIGEHDLLYSEISESEFRKYKNYKDLLNEEQKELLKEIAEIKRKNNPTWGI